MEIESIDGAMASKQYAVSGRPGESARGSVGLPPMETPVIIDDVQHRAEKSPVLWTNVAWPVCLLLILVGVIHQATGGYAKEIVLELNAMFDSVWCPLPTWVHILLVFAAWALFYRVGKDFVKL